MPANESVSSSGSNDTPEESNTTNGHQVSLIAGHNIWEWIFLLVSIWNVALLLASSGIAIDQCELSRKLTNPEFTTEVVTIVVSIIAIVFAVYGVHEEHQFDMYLHLIFVAVADFFCFLAARKTTTSCHHCFKIICFAVSAGMTLFNTFVAYKATTASDWTEFRIIGASESLAKMYKKQCAFLSLLKFDSLFVVICAFYSFPITLEFPVESKLYLLLVLIVMYSFMSWSCGKVTVCKEDKYLASGFVVLCMTYPCLVIYQIYMSNHKTLVDDVFHESARDIGYIIILCKILLSCVMVQICGTFGYGLNTRSLDVLKKSFDRPSKNKASNGSVSWCRFLKEICHMKCPSKDKEKEFTYKDIYRF